MLRQNNAKSKSSQISIDVKDAKAESLPESNLTVKDANAESLANI